MTEHSPGIHHQGRERNTRLKEEDGKLKEAEAEEQTMHMHAHTAELKIDRGKMKMASAKRKTEIHKETQREIKRQT